MDLVNVLACGAGFVSGLTAAWLSMITSSRLGDGGFWKQLASVSRLLLSDETDNPFLREYVRLWPLLIAFVLKKLVVTLAAILPIALAFGVLTLIPVGDSDSAGVPPQEIPFLVAACLSTLLGLVVLRQKRGRTGLSAPSTAPRSENRAP